MPETCHLFYLKKKNLNKFFLPFFILIFSCATFIMTVNAIAHQSIIYTVLALFFGYMIYMLCFATYRLFKIKTPHLKITPEAIYHEGIWKKSEYIKFIDIISTNLKLHTISGQSICDLVLNDWDIQAQHKTGYGKYTEILRIRIFPESYASINLDFATWITVLKRMNTQQRQTIIQQWNQGEKPNLNEYLSEKDLKYYQENNVILIGNHIKITLKSH